MNRHLSRDDRDALRAELSQMTDWAVGAVDIARQLHAQNPALYRGFGNARAPMLSLVGAGGGMELYDGTLRVCDADGAVIVDGASDQDYLALIAEEVKPWTYIKFPYLNSLGPAAGWYRVGPLARLQTCNHIPSPRAESERLDFRSWHDDAPAHGALAYHWARMIEVLHALEHIAELLDDPELLEGELMREATRRGAGVGVIEAPRGTLIHHYTVGDDDLIAMCNLIVATTHNNQAMNEAVRSVAREYLDGQELSEALPNHIEVAIRAYDPCLSCATHALGQMPLDVALLGPDGTVLDHLTRTHRGEVARVAADPAR